MVEIKIEGSEVIFEVRGWDKVWSLTNRLAIPASHIRGAHKEPHAEMGWFQGFKLAGANIPDLFRAGIFLQKGEVVFWDVRERERAITVELDHEHYKKLIIEVADPDLAIATLQSVAAARKG